LLTSFLTPAGSRTRAPRRLHNWARDTRQARLLALEVNLVVLCDLFQHLEVL